MGFKLSQEAKKKRAMQIKGMQFWKNVGYWKDSMDGAKSSCES